MKQKILSAIFVLGVGRLWGLLPVDISFFAIDLKFNRGTVKILEFQDGPTAGLRAYDYVFKKGGVWRSFWRELFSLGLPVWYVGPYPHKEIDQEFSHHDWDHNAFDYFLNHGGMYASTLGSLKNNKFFNQTLSKKSRTPGSVISARAIVLEKIEDQGSRALQDFVSAFPGAIVVNRFLRSYSINKQRTHKLLSDVGLDYLRPASKIYRKYYYPKLAARIKHDLGGDIFVIKPINSSRSNGVLVVSFDELDGVLKKILSPAYASQWRSGAGEYRPAKTLGITYWEKDPNREFIVESYEPSQDLRVNGKRYDPTMRVLWYMVCSGEQIEIKRLAAFWKVSSASLDDEAASLTNKHVSMFRDDFSQLNPQDLTVQEDDLKKLDAVMVTALSSMYRYVLANPLW